MPPYHLADGRQLILERRLGEGAEGTVWLLGGGSECAKILRPELRAAKADKLEYMVRHPAEAPNGGGFTIAWPRALVFEAGAFAGFTMAFAKGARKLNDIPQGLLSPILQPQVDRFQFRYNVAWNLAEAFKALHAKGYLVGDVKPPNVLVYLNATVILIDADSLQLTNHETGRPYLNPFTTRPYQSPEYFVTQYDRATLGQDDWALAVLIFQLLTTWHPYLGSGGSATTTEDRVRDGLYPYTAHPRQNVRPPQDAPPINNLHRRIVQGFENSFVTSHLKPAERPTASQWVAILNEAHLHLVQGRCGHYYFDHLRSCPTCPIICPKCRKNNDASSQPYCKFCGEQLPPYRTCPNPACREPRVPTRATMCHKCGRSLMPI